MISLIISLIAIALIALTIAITMFDLGDTFTSGSQRAELAKLQNEGGQISIATNLYIVRNTGKSPSSVQDLVDERYLKSIPGALRKNDKSEDWEFRFDNFVSLPISTEDICVALNKNAGHDSETIPQCSDGYSHNAPCCTLN